MQPQMGIWKRFCRSLSDVDKFSLNWESGRGLLEVYWGWTDAPSFEDVEGGLLEVYWRWTDASLAWDLEDVY